MGNLPKSQPGKNSQSTRVVFKWNRETMWNFPYGYYLFPSFSGWRRPIITSEQNNFNGTISYIDPKSAWKSKRSVMEPLCLSDRITVIIYSQFFFFTFPSSVAVFVAGTGSKLWEVPTASFTSSTNLSESLQSESNCQYRHLQDTVRIMADIPPRLDGTWVSTRYISFKLSCCAQAVKD